MWNCPKRPQRLYRINTLFSGSLTSHIGYLVHWRVEVKFSKQFFYGLCETLFMIKRNQEKLTGNSGELITLSSQINLRKLQSIAVRSAVTD